MQRVERVNPNVSPILDEIDGIYSLLSELPTQRLVKPTYDSSFADLVDIFNWYGGHTWDVVFKDKDYAMIDTVDNKNLILSFSGGKDSVAAAMKYQELGYNVYLYHMRHINPSFSDEWECAEELARLLDLPIFFDDIKFKGYHMWMEHPMKNMIIANGALSYGVREGISTHIAFGNYTTSLLEDNVFERCAGDCMDMWDSYDTIISRIIPNFEMGAILDNMGDTLNTLADRADLLDASLSCLCRHSLRDYRRQWVKDKFGIELFHKRCGSCYKCCVEYIYMADHNKIKFSEDYYKYCLNQLYKVALAENTPVGDVYDLWDSFIFYPVSKSKIERDLYTVTVGAKSLKWQ